MAITVDKGIQRINYWKNRAHQVLTPTRVYSVETEEMVFKGRR